MTSIHLTREKIHHIHMDLTYDTNQKRTFSRDILKEVDCCLEILNKIEDFSVKQFQSIHSLEGIEKRIFENIQNLKTISTLDEYNEILDLIQDLREHLNSLQYSLSNSPEFDIITTREFWDKY